MVLVSCCLFHRSVPGDAKLECSLLAQNWVGCSFNEKYEFAHQHTTDVVEVEWQVPLLLGAGLLAGVARNRLGAMSDGLVKSVLNHASWSFLLKFFQHD